MRIFSIIIIIIIIIIVNVRFPGGYSPVSAEVPFETRSNLGTHLFFVAVIFAFIFRIRIV